MNLAIMAPIARRPADGQVARSIEIVLVRIEAEEFEDAA
jgi:hypothetical protein